MAVAEAVGKAEAEVAEAEAKTGRRRKGLGLVAYFAKANTG